MAEHEKSIFLKQVFFFYRYLHNQGCQYLWILSIRTYLSIYYQSLMSSPIKSFPKTDANHYIFIFYLIRLSEIRSISHLINTILRTKFKVLQNVLFHVLVWLKYYTASSSFSRRHLKISFTWYYYSCTRQKWQLGRVVSWNRSQNFGISHQ